MVVLWRDQIAGLFWQAASPVFGLRDALGANTERLQAELSHQTSYFAAVRAQDNAAPANSGDFFAKGSTFTFSDTTPPAALTNLSALSGTSPVLSP